MHINDLAARAWVQRPDPRSHDRTAPEAGREAALSETADRRRHVRSVCAVLRKYIGSKVFSIEGAEVLIPLLDAAIEKAAGQGIVQIVMGMAHRGRLAVLANILGKQPRRIFAGIQDQAPARTWRRRSSIISATAIRGPRAPAARCCCRCASTRATSNSSTPWRFALRAKEDRDGDIYHEHGMAILIHGDAAVAGEGIVQETLNLAPLRGYFTGGNLHIVINNQIGFTTPPQMSRAGVYCTDIAKMLETPNHPRQRRRARGRDEGPGDGDGLPQPVPRRCHARRLLLSPPRA